MAAAARECGVKIVTGDTKVVDRGKGDGIFINTAGIGVVPTGVEISPAALRRAMPFSLTAISAGTAWRSCRSAKGWASRAISKRLRQLAGLVEALLAFGRYSLPARPTRGGLAAALNEIAA